MHEEELAQVRQQVAATGDAIQSLLLPHEGLAHRNAYAHIWLGIRTRFGEEWRQRCVAAEVLAFVAWIGANPNADYDDFAGAITHLPKPPAPRKDPGLFDCSDSFAGAPEPDS